jgi:hypothetical protein
MQCKNANAMRKCECDAKMRKKCALHRLLNNFKKKNEKIDRLIVLAFAIAFASHYQPCYAMLVAVVLKILRLQSD